MNSENEGRLCYVLQTGGVLNNFSTEHIDEQLLFLHIEGRVLENHRYMFLLLLLKHLGKHEKHGQLMLKPLSSRRGQVSVVAQC